MHPHSRPGSTLLTALTAFMLCQSAPVSAAPPPVLFAASLPAQGEYGSIKGRLVWGGANAPAAKVLVEQGKAAKDPEVCGKEAPVVNHELAVDPKTRGVAYGFVYLIKPKGANPEAVKALLAKSPKVELDQKNCEFLPYALAIHQDQTLVIKSSDPVNHNVRYSAFTNAPFNQILAPRGELEAKLVAEKRPILVACDIHNWMKAILMVFDHPFFAVTGEDGSFEIRGVPAGDQNMIVWQEKVGYVNPEKVKGTPVTVKAGEATDVGSVTINPSQVK
jgi:hypothetical protein